MDALLRRLAEITFALHVLRYQIGCRIVYTLDRVQDLVALEQRKQESDHNITAMNQVFDEACHTKFNDFLSAYARTRGPPSTGTPEVRSIAKFTHDELIALGKDFSIRPSSLGLDGAVDHFWSLATASPGIASTT